MASVSGAYLDCIKRLNLNEYQNDIRIYNVSELYLEAILNEYQNRLHIWSVSEFYLEVVLNEYQNGICFWTVSEHYHDCTLFNSSC